MSQEQQHKKEIYEDEISLKELILKIQEYFNFLLSKWLWIVIAGFIGLIIGVTIAITTPANFIATNTFMVQEDEGGGMGGIGSALSSFGFGGIQTGKYNYDKVVSVARSKRVIMDALLDTIYQNDTIIVNRLIDVYEMGEDLEENENIGISEVRRNVPFDSLNRIEKVIMNKLYSKVAGENAEIFSISYDEDSKLITANVNTTQEVLSYSLAHSIYNYLNEFYTHQATRKYKENVAVFKSRLDSVENTLNVKESALARERDRNSELFLDVDRVQQGRLMRDVKIASQAYGEILKNYEAARYMLSTVRPVFTVVDGVYFPVNRKGKSFIVEGIKYGVVFGFISVIFFVGRRYYVEMMAEGNPHSQ